MANRHSGGMFYPFFFIRNILAALENDVGYAVIPFDGRNATQTGAPLTYATNHPQSLSNYRFFRSVIPLNADSSLLYL